MTGTNWQGWKITDKQAEEIRKGNTEARNRFYMDNYERIGKMARNYVYKRHMASAGLEYDTDDCINGVYVDLPLFNFKSGKTLSWSVRNSFYLSIFGGWQYVVENDSKLLNGEYRGERLFILDSPTKANARTGESSETSALVLDSIASVPSPEEELIENDGIPAEKIVEIVKGYLSPRECEIFSLLLDGYSVYAIPELLGLKNITKQYARIKARLRINYEKIMDDLEDCGAVIPQYAKGQPEKYADSVKMLETHKRRCSSKSMTPEQRARANARRRERRARKRQETAKKTATK